MNMAQPSPEAIKESRDALHDNQSPGAIALRSAVIAYENGWYANFPSPESQEARDLARAFKPPRFAVIAESIDLMLEATFEKRQEKDEIGSLDYLYKPEDKWNKIEKHFRDYFLAGIESIEQTEPFAYLDRVNKLMRYLDENSYITASTQIRRGTNTARKTNVSILQLIPGLIEHHSPETPRDQWGKIAKNSSNLSYSLSRRSVESMVAGREVAVENPDPTKFKPIFNDEKLVSFKFNHLDSQVVPIGYTPLKYLTPLDSPTTVGEIASTTRTVIGCPITLLSGRLRQLWEWMAETVDESGVWGKEEISRLSLTSAAKNVDL
jgi:hypothetical protein